MLDVLNAILLGIIEGITEFLPISSTGHLLIAEHWLGQRSDTFNIVIQAGAMLAVTLVYWSRLVALATKIHLPENRLYAAKLLFAFAITAVLGLVAKKLGFKLPETISPVAWALLIGGIWILFAEWWARRQPNRTEVSWLVAVLVGVAQVVARSGATIFAAMLGGRTDRAAATEFAFPPCMLQAPPNSTVSTRSASRARTGLCSALHSSSRRSSLSSPSNGCWAIFAPTRSRPSPITGLPWVSSFSLCSADL